MFLLELGRSNTLAISLRGLLGIILGSEWSQMPQQPIKTNEERDKYPQIYREFNGAKRITNGTVLEIEQCKNSLGGGVSQDDSQ